MLTGREFGDTSNARYYAYIAKHDIPNTEENRTLFNAAFYLGAQYSAAVTTALSPHVARFVEYVMWLEIGSDGAREMPAVREDDYPSPPY